LNDKNKKKTPPQPEQRQVFELCGTSCLPSLRSGHITADIRLRFAPPKCSTLPRTSYVHGRYPKVAKNVIVKFSPKEDNGTADEHRQLLIDITRIIHTKRAKGEGVTI